MLDTARLILVVSLVLAFSASVLAEDAGVAYAATFSGTFALTFAGGPHGEDELRFAGRGDGTPTGPSRVAGRSLTVPAGPGCFEIVEDEVTWSTPQGALFLVNGGEDCVDLLTEPGRVVIRGSGSTAIVGGTGAYAGAHGSGTWSVTARVSEFGVGPAQDGTAGPPIAVGAHGEFDALRFEGTLTLG